MAKNLTETSALTSLNQIYIVVFWEKLNRKLLQETLHSCVFCAK